jgi:uncharacterized membrane protein
VPGLTIVVAYVLVIISIMLLVVYVHHIGRSLRVSSLIELVGRATRRTLDVRYPDRGEPSAAAADIAAVCAPHSGVLSLIDEDRLVAIAQRAGCVLEIQPALGAFVPAGATLVRIEGPVENVDVGDVLAALPLDLDRNLDQDVAYGMRMLVDIAERSLAESAFLDPTTAVQALDRLHDCLRQLARRPFPSGTLRDAQMKRRVIVARMTWPDYVQLAFQEIRLAGAGSPQVTRRIEEALLDLREIVPADRRECLDEQLDLLRTSVEDHTSEPRDVSIALVPDRQGLGIGNQIPAVADRSEREVV